MAKPILVTGASGGVARMLLRGPLAERELRFTDRVSPSESSGSSVLIGDLTDQGFVTEVTSGVDAIVHLAGNPNPRCHWPELVGPNLTAPTNLLTAAVENGVRRVVFASSLHTMAPYRGGDAFPAEPSWPVNPCCEYGATKAFMEAAARATYRRHGLSSICLRLGAVVEQPSTVGDLGAWLGPEDLCQLVERSLDAEIGFGIYHGVSANTPSVWSIENARNDLDYQPILDSRRYADVVDATDIICESTPT